MGLTSSSDGHDKICQRVRSLRTIDDIKMHYRISQTIGSGAYGEVYKAVHKLSKMDCAIKAVPKDKISASKFKSE